MQPAHVDAPLQRNSLASAGITGCSVAATERPSGVHHLTAEYMERSAAKGPRGQSKRTLDVTVLDIADNIASARVASEPFVDYLPPGQARGPMVDRQRSLRGSRAR